MYLYALSREVIADSICLAILVIFENVVQCCGVILEIHLGGRQEIQPRYLEHNTSLSPLPL